MAQAPQIPDRFDEISFTALAGWQNDDHAAALKSFLRLCRKPEILEANGLLPRLSRPEQQFLCRDAEEAALKGAPDARRFFETHFRPYRITRKGFVTGYFEPELAASRVKTADYSVPLLKKPDGLEPVTGGNRPQDWPADLSHGRRQDGILSEMPDRGAIMDGALDPEKLELVWLADPVDAFFVHVQGSARLRLSDGSVMRVGYAGKTGHPYTGIAKLLVTRGEGTPEDFTMSGLRHWLEDHPDQVDSLLRENRSYIFFREADEISPEDGPVGAAGLPLTAGRSLAVDPAFMPYGALVFVASDIPDPAGKGSPFARLMVADDTGSAIKGPARGDIFTGSGDLAGAYAGEIRHAADFTVLVPAGAIAAAAD
ncbi:murein transglycosylase A [Roseibium sp. M-1]